jgi:hypothetical protein
LIEASKDRADAVYLKRTPGILDRLLFSFESFQSEKLLNCEDFWWIGRLGSWAIVCSLLVFITARGQQEDKVMGIEFVIPLPSKSYSA